MTPDPDVSLAPITRVSVVDVKMPFGSMVVFMIKWAIAAIPAVIILAALFAFLLGMLTALVRR